MDQNVNYYGIILLLRQLRESGSFSEKELRRVAARIAADSGADRTICSRQRYCTPGFAPDKDTNFSRKPRIMPFLSARQDKNVPEAGQSP